MIAIAPPIDLAAERAASQARRDRDHQDTSARVLLHLAAPGASPETLAEWAEQAHPHWTPERRAALVDRALELQEEERARTTVPVPDETMPFLSGLLPSEQLLSDPRERAALEERMETYRHKPLPAAAAVEEPMPETESSTARPSTSDVRRVIIEILTADPTRTFAEIRTALEERYGVPFKVGHMGKAWARVRAELGLDQEATNGARPEEPEAAPPPLSSLAAPRPAVDPLPPESAPEVKLEPLAEPEPDTPPPAVEHQEEAIAPPPGRDVAAILEENRDLRGTYEAEGIHLEELGGEWRIRVNLLFDTREEALRMLGRFFGMRTPA